MLFVFFFFRFSCSKTMDVSVVSFRLPGHGDTALSNMNFLRTQQHFCDVTIVAGGRRMFRGHKVVLAACSAFLRDQFILNPSSELQVRGFSCIRITVTATSEANQLTFCLY